MAAGIQSRGIAAARQYVEHGWRVVPVPLGSKNPIEHDWPANHYEPDDIGDGNVGVILGPVSGELVDIDLDSRAALDLAPYFLPPTLTFGHPRKPRSHWLYICEGIRSSNLIFRVAGEVERVEVRAKNATSEQCGHQSVFPGSIWTSKDKTHQEPVDWDEDAAHDEPQEIGAGELAWCVARLAVACVIADGWESGAQRNALTMGYAGGLLSLGWTADEVRDALQAVRECAGDEEASALKNEGAVERTIAAFEAGTLVTGFGSLVRDGIIEQSKLKDIERHAKTPKARAAELKLAKTRTGKAALDRMVREAQEVDALSFVADAIAEAATPLEQVIPRSSSAGITSIDSRLGRIVDLSTPPAPLEYLCEGLCIAPGKISSIGGYPGTGKGPFLNLFALCVASGRPFLGHKVERRKVSLVDFETGPLVELRLKRLANALKLDLKELHAEKWITLIHGRAPIDDEVCALLEASLEPGMLLGIDSYTSGVPGDQNDSAIAEVAFRLGSMSASLGVAVLANTHERKQQNGKRADDLEMMSGHNALAAAMQTAISLTRPADKDKALIEVRCARAPEEPFDTFCIRWEDVTAPDARDTIGGRLKAEKWGFIARRVEKPAAGETTEEMLRQIEACEAPIMMQMQAHYAGGIKAHVATLVGTSGGDRARENRRTAIRNLVAAGRLLANFNAKRSVQGGGKQLVWLPGAQSEWGIIQT